MGEIRLMEPSHVPLRCPASVRRSSVSGVRTVGAADLIHQLSNGLDRRFQVAHEPAIFEKAVIRRGKRALTQSWCISLSSLCGPDQTCPKQIQVSSAVHLPLDQLEFRILPLGLAVRPWLCESRLYRRAVLGDPGCE